MGGQIGRRGITTVVTSVAAKGEMGMSSDGSIGECNVRIWKYENEKLRRCENEEMQEEVLKKIKE